MQYQPKKVFKYLYQESYLAFINNSVGTKMFRSYYVDKNGRPHDVLKKGQLSCSYYASIVLRAFGLIKKMHFTSPRTADDLIACGAKKVPISKLEPGDVLIWSTQKGQLGVHNHIGFYVGNKKAISNSEKKKMVVKHDYLFNGKRDIELALRPNWNTKHAKS